MDSRSEESSRGAYPDTTAGARTFLSAATPGRRSAPSARMFASNAAADRIVRAPGLAAVSRCAHGEGTVGIPLALLALTGKVRPAFSPPVRWLFALTKEQATC